MLLTGALFWVTPRRRTKFCAEGNPRVPNEHPIVLRAHWRHNGADEDCDYQPKTA